MNNNHITVGQLLVNCQSLVARGYGDKVVFICEDEEGNGAHELPFTFTYGKSAKEMLDSMLVDMNGLDADDIVILG